MNFFFDRKWEAWWPGEVRHVLKTAVREDSGIRHIGGSWRSRRVWRLVGRRHRYGFRCLMALVLPAIAHLDRFRGGGRARSRGSRRAAVRGAHPRVERPRTAVVRRRLDSSALGLCERGLWRCSDSMILHWYRVPVVSPHRAGRFILAEGLGLRGRGLSFGCGGAVPHFSVWLDL